MKPPISSVTRKHREDVIFYSKKVNLAKSLLFLQKSKKGVFLYYGQDIIEKIEIYPFDYLNKKRIQSNLSAIRSIWIFI